MSADEPADLEPSWGGGPLQVLWQKDLGRSIVESPVMIPGAILVATTDRRLYCFDLETGQKRWRKKFKQHIPASPAYLDGQSVADQSRSDQSVADQSPAGRVFVFHGHASGTLRCLDAAKGDDLWRVRTKHRIKQIEVSGDRLLTLDVAGRLIARSIDDGSEIWTFERLGWDPPDFLFEESRLYAAARRDSIFRLDPSNGESVWGCSIPGTYAAPASMFGEELLVCDVDGKLTRLDPGTGATLGVDQRRAMQTGGIVPLGSKILTVTTSGIVEARDPRDPKGEGVSWEFDIGTAVETLPVIASPLVLVATTGGQLLALREERGEKAWTLEFNGPLRVSPIVTDRHLIVATNRGDLYVYEHTE